MAFRVRTTVSLRRREFVTLLHSAHWIALETQNDGNVMALGTLISRSCNFAAAAIFGLGVLIEDMGTYFRTMTAQGQSSDRLPAQRLAYQRGFVLENTIISCVLGSNLDGGQFVIMPRPTAKGHF